MDKYNAEHYWDETAAIAISRADKARRRLKKEPIRRLAGLTYRIGEIFRVFYICDPDKNRSCSKTSCAHNPRAVWPECRLTTRVEYALDDSGFAIVPLYGRASKELIEELQRISAVSG